MGSILCNYKDDININNININTSNSNFINKYITNDIIFINFIHELFSTPIKKKINVNENQKIFVLDFDGPIVEQIIKNNILNNTFGNEEDMLEMYITNYKILVFVLYILHINNVYIVNGSQRITMNKEGIIFRNQMYDILNKAFGENRNILVEKLSNQISYDIYPENINNNKVILLYRYYNHFRLYNDKLQKKNIFLIDDNLIYKNSVIKSGYSFIICNRNTEILEDNYYLIKMLQQGLNCSNYNIKLIILELIKHIPEYKQYIYKLYTIFNYYNTDKSLYYKNIGIIY